MMTDLPIRTGAEPELPVLVVGAGPSGLTMAGELARRGVGCRIIDVSRSATDRSRALGVQARTLEVLENMGLAHELVERGNPCSGASFYQRGSRIFQLSLTELDTPFPHLLIAPQSETEGVLIRNLERLGGVVERETRLVRFTQDAAGVTATLEHGDGRQEEVRCAWIIGCDGAHSTVRRELGMTFEGEDYAEGFMLADVRLDWPLNGHELHVFLQDGWILGAVPFGNGYWRIIADVPPEDAPRDSAPSMEQLQALVRERASVPAAVSDPIWTANYRVHRRIVSRLREGRVFLMGDAAHIHNPAGGQGMNTGIQDAFNLAWKLALVVQDVAAPALLGSYHAERFPVEQSVLRGTDRMLKVASLRAPAAQKVRNTLAPFLSQFAFVRRRAGAAISELGVHYRRSPIVENHFIGAGPLAGDRAPDARVLAGTGGDPARLYELLRTGSHALLLFAGADAAERDALLALGRMATDHCGAHVSAHLVLPGEHCPEGLAWEGSVWLDPDGGCHARYGARSAGLFLIRPDGYIGYRALAGEARRSFPRHLRRIFETLDVRQG